MPCLDRVLRKPILDVPRTRRYQEMLDQRVDKARKEWTPEFLANTAFSRAFSAPLCQAAFCWYSPLSRHHGDPALLHVFTEGLRHAANRIERACDGDALESVWSLGWDIEGLVYGSVFCRDALALGLTTKARDAILRLMRRAAAAEKVPQVIGSSGP